jgi:hypothetical protein
MTTSPAVLAFSLLIITIQADLFNALAIPESQLPGGCRIVAAPGSPELGLRAGRWGALPIDANPWRGSDRIVVAAIRERIDPPQMVPDGPPLHPRDLAAFRRNLADGVEQAYAAIYESADRQQVGVFAVQFQSDASFEAAAARVKKRQVFQAAVERTLAAVWSYGESACTAAVESHVRRVFRR